MNDLSLIQNNYKKLLSSLPDNVQLVVVSKTHPVESIQHIYDLGQKVFGENRVQELLEKQALLPQDIQWHLIGHLQTNKVKYIAPFIDLIQSVDSPKILKEINRQAKIAERKIKVLLQVKIAAEDTKYGLSFEEARGLFNQYLQGDFPYVKVTGLMGMATFTDDHIQITKEFSMLKKLFEEFNGKTELETLSMGMSGDFPVAIAAGATSIRVGSAIFGTR